jgi:hypothetical protein
MEDRFNQIANAISEKTLDQCSVEELEEMVQQYPWFSAARFLLLRKKEVDGVDSSSLMQKTILYYHDPVSFAHFMHPQKTDDRFLHEDPAPQPKVVPEKPLPAQDHTVVEKPFVQPDIAPEPASVNTPPPDETLAFEPFHTVDYFASQGIRPSKEEPKDTLGKQLKSFTDWLKTMKKLPEATTVKVADPKVEDMASRSLGDPHVVTEAMAEVWIKQGNREKAREIYEKLSLSDPSKKAYFAAKIDNLNAD